LGVNDIQSEEEAFLGSEEDETAREVDPLSAVCRPEIPSAFSQTDIGSAETREAFAAIGTAEDRRAADALDAVSVDEGGRRTVDVRGRRDRTVRRAQS